MTSHKEDPAGGQVQSVGIQGKSVVVSTERLKIVNRAREGEGHLQGILLYACCVEIVEGEENMIDFSM